jgi:cytochrome c5
MTSRDVLRKFAAPAAIAMAFAASTTAVAEPNMDKYNRACNACHAAGVAGAPKTGDAEAWAPRMEQGMDALLASVKNGKGAMPPMGLCNDCTDEEFKELITYMSTAK